MSFGLGLIGAGSIASLHAAAAGRAGVRIPACCDLDVSRARRLADRHPGMAVEDSVDDLLARADVRAVVVAVPNDQHRAVAVRALEAGKDVLLEKPMAMNLAECDEIIAARDRAGAIVQLGFVTRYAPTVRVAQRMVESGRLGRVYHVRAQWLRRRGIPGLGGWFTERRRSGGGVLIDLGVHLVDVMLHVAGRPAVRRASGVCTSNFGPAGARYTFHEMWAGPPRPDGVFDVEDGATGLLRCDGCTLDLTVSWAANAPESMLPGSVLVLGDRGGCYFEPWGRTVVVSTEDDGQLVDVHPALPPGDPWETAWTREHELFADAVTSRTPPAASAEDGRAVQAILAALYRSDEREREVEVDGD